MHGLVHPVERPQRKHKRENEQTRRIADNVVAQQGGRDDARGVLAACDLDRHQERAEREDEERERHRDDRLEQRARARHVQTQEPGGEIHQAGAMYPQADGVHQARGNQKKHNCNHGHEPERGSDVASRAVPQFPVVLGHCQALEQRVKHRASPCPALSCSSAIGKRSAGLCHGSALSRVQYVVIVNSTTSARL